MHKTFILTFRMLSKILTVLTIGQIYETQFELPQSEATLIFKTVKGCDKTKRIVVVTNSAVSSSIKYKKYSKKKKKKREIREIDDD